MTTPMVPGTTVTSGQWSPVITPDNGADTGGNMGDLVPGPAVTVCYHGTKVK